MGLPIETLICGPILAAAKGQQQLCAVYVDTIMKLAFKDGKEDSDTNQLVFKYERPVVDTGTKQVSAATFEIYAPLLSLVPVPAFTMSDLTVDFNCFSVWGVHALSGGGSDHLPICLDVCY